MCLQQDGCRLQRSALAHHALDPGQKSCLLTLPAAPTSDQATIGACCASCSSTPGCTAWSYCSQKGGCANPGAASVETLPYGWCRLLSATTPPQVLNSDPTVVSVASGYVTGGSAAAAGPVVTAAAGPAGIVGRKRLV